MMVGWKQFIGQKQVKEHLRRTMEKATLAHAYLWVGEPGVGTFQAALELSMSLLCTDPGIRPCYRCPSCRQVLHGNHPDFHHLFPISFTPEQKGSTGSGHIAEAGWAFIAEQAKLRINNPYCASGSALEHIPVEWIRHLLAAIRRGPVQADNMAVVISDIDTVQASSANALLKTLEEPPAHVYIILTTRRLNHVLPTIRSRCQIIRFGLLNDDDICNHLCGVTGKSATDSALRHAVLFAQGSLDKALSALGSQENENRMEQAKSILQFILRTPCADHEAVAAFADSLKAAGAMDAAEAEQMLAGCMHMLRFAFLPAYGSMENNYFYDDLLDGCPVPALSVQQMDAVLTCGEEALEGIKAYGNIPLILVLFLVSSLEIIHGKKQ